MDGNVSVLQEDIHPGPGSADVTNGTSEGNDPNCMFAIRSSLDLPHNIQFDSVLRYVGDLPNPPTPAYLTMDVRLAWAPNSHVEIAVVGRNLLDDKHPEFSAGPQGVTREVERSVFGTFKWHF